MVEVYEGGVCVYVNRVWICGVVGSLQVLVGGFFFTGITRFEIFFGNLISNRQKSSDPSKMHFHNYCQKSSAIYLFFAIFSPMLFPPIIISADDNGHD